MNVIKKQSRVAGSKPVAGVLANGEIAINTVDGIIYSKDTTANIKEFRETPTFHELHDLQERDALVGDRSLHEGDFVRYVIGGIYQTDTYYNGKWYKVETSPPLFVMVIKMNTTNEPTFTDIVGGNIHVVERADNSWLVYSEDEIERIRFDGFKDEVIYIMIIKSDHLTSMESMFDGCSELEGCGFSRLETPHVRNMANMFKGCIKLEHTYSMLFDTSKVETMEGMFDGCSGLLSAEIDHFDTSNVESTARMFANCSLLPDIDISHFSADSVINAKSMFDGCSLIEDLDFVKFTLPVAMNTQTMFKDCTSLKCLSSINTTASADVAAKANMFANTPSLEEPVPADIVDIVDADGSNWINSLPCPKLLTLKWDSFTGVQDVSIEAISSAVDGSIMEYSSDGGNTWTDVNKVSGRNLPPTAGSTGPCILREKIPGVVTRVAFTSSSGYSKLTGHMSVSGGLGLISAEKMFYACEGLTSIDLSKMFSANIATFEEMTSGCSHVAEINLKNFDTSAATTMEAMFYNNDALLKLDLSSFDMTKVTDTHRMFYGCDILECISNVDTVSSANKTDMFSNCASLVNPTVAEQANIVDANGMFYVNQNICDTYVPKVKKLDMMITSPTEPGLWSAGTSYTVDYHGGNLWNLWSENDVSKIILGANKIDITKVVINKAAPLTCEGMFFGLEKLTDLDLSGLDTSNATSFETMFADCTKISSIDLTMLDGGKIINTKRMFSNCTSLSDVKMFTSAPTGDMSEMFKDCTSLECMSELNTASSTNKTDMFANAAMLEFPMAAEVADIIDANGATWVNPNECKRTLSVRWNTTGYSGDIKAHVSGSAPLLYSSDGGTTWSTIPVSTIETSVTFPYGSGGPFTIKESVLGSMTALRFSFSLNKSLFSGHMIVEGGAGLINADEMFNECSHLTSFDFSKFDGRNITSTKHMFLNCSAVTSIDLRNTKISKTTNTAGMFDNCSSALYIGLFPTPLSTESYQMFSGASKLICISRIHLPTGINTGGMFNHTSALVSPNSTEQADIANNGLDWTNPNPCP